MESIKFKRKTMTKRGIVARLLHYYKISSPESINGGLFWYHEAHSFCVDLANKGGREAFQVAGVVAALSPMMSWDVTKQQATQFVIYNKRGLHTSAQMSKADDCLVADSPEKIFGLLTKNALKTSWFFWNILYPDTASGVTIDRHAIGSCIYSPSNAVVLEEGYGNMTKNQYDFFMGAYIRGAEIIQILPHQLQAIVWMTYRATRALPVHKETPIEIPF